MQARAPRVPEVCVDHTSPRCLVACPFTKMEYWLLFTLVHLDPWLTQEGPMTSLMSALYQLFVRSCDLAHDGQHCSHFCANTHCRLLLLLSLVLAFVYLCSQMEEHQNVRPSTGTTERNHSLHCTLPNNSMITRSPRLCIHWSPPKRLTGPRPEALRSVHSETTRPHQLTCSCGAHSQRHGEALLAEAVTQLIP